MRDREDLAMQVFDKIIADMNGAEAAGAVIHGGADPKTTAEGVAKFCYAIADAVLAERAK